MHFYFFLMLLCTAKLQFSKKIIIKDKEPNKFPASQSYVCSVQSVGVVYYRFSVFLNFLYLICFKNIDQCFPMTNTPKSNMYYVSRYLDF